MFAFAHHVPDVAEHKEIAGDGARQARDIVGIPGDEAAGKVLGKMCGRIFFHDGSGYPLRQSIVEGDVLVPRQLDKAVGKIGIAGSKRSLDIPVYFFAIPQSRIKPEIGQFRRVVLRQKHGKGFARMRPQHRVSDRERRKAD